jgi:HD-GYP domain-containing protein (c-di-GMP phosphodiesterase class II)
VEALFGMKIRMDELLSSIGTALDIVEGELLGATTNHGRRIATLSAAMAKKAALPDDAVFDIAACALLHDNALTEYILSEQPGKDQEINLVTHCVIGQENVKTLPFRTNVDGYVLYHHERADGKGPFGKKQGEFPEEVALIAIADAVDARYKLQYIAAEALPELLETVRAQAGKIFTMDAARLFCETLDKDMLEALRDENIAQTYSEVMPVWEVELSDKALMGVASLTARIIDYKSKFTRRHSVQISNIAWRMGKYYKFSNNDCALLYLAASLHDLGKLKVPNEILEKPGKLTDDEFELIKKHSQWTYDMLSGVAGFAPINERIVNHHEKLNGKGYPKGLGADGLDFISRLIACIDIYQAISEERPYHPARSHQETMPIMYDMAQKGEIDAQIVTDLDSEIGKNINLWNQPPVISFH